MGEMSLNYLYVAATVAIRRRNCTDSAAVSIAVTMVIMRIRNKVSETTYLYSDCDVALVVWTIKLCCCFFVCKKNE